MHSTRKMHYRRLKKDSALDHPPRVMLVFIRVLKGKLPTKGSYAHHIHRPLRTDRVRVRVRVRIMVRIRVDIAIRNSQFSRVNPFDIVLSHEVISLTSRFSIRKGG